MNISLPEFRTTVLENLLELLWRQWSAIGVAGTCKSEQQSVVDPEALLLLSLTVARYDVRLFDEIIDWVGLNGAFLNVQRLKNLINQYDFQATAQVSALAERAKQNSSLAPKWKSLASQYSNEPEEVLFFQVGGHPFPYANTPDQIFHKHGLVRETFASRNLAQRFPASGMPSLLLRLRALLGINIRCEIFCVLGSVGEMHPSLLAKKIGYAVRTTQNALAEMVGSGAVQVRSCAREKLYCLVPGVMAELLHPGAENTRWDSSAPLFRALEVLWLGLTDPDRQDLDDVLLAAHWRQMAEKMEPLWGEAQLGQPMRDVSLHKGTDYGDIFVTDINAILANLT